MLLSGLLLIALTIAGLWACMPGKNSEKKSFLRGGADVVVAIAVTAGLGIGILMTVIGLAG